MTSRRLFSVMLTAALAWSAPGSVGAGELESAAPEPEGPAPASAPSIQPVVAAQAPVGILIKDPLNRLEFRLPGEYWEHRDRDSVAAQARGGCGPSRVSPNLLFILQHKDAPASVWCERGPRSFLMRGKDDLETFVNATIGAVRSQVGESVEEVESSYEERDGMILHRLGFTAPLPAGGGCAPRQAPAEDQPNMRYLSVHYFVRPEGADAMAFKMHCLATEEVFGQLESEFEFIISSLRYTGELAAEFFVPDAPEDKVLTPKEAARAAGAKKGGVNWLLPVGMIVIIWIMIRRRKKAPA